MRSSSWVIRFCKLRSRAGLSQEGLAARCELHRTYVGGIERGERDVSYANLLKLAAALGVRASELLAAAESGPGGDGTG